MELKNKFILDACCSVKQMWYNKNHPNTIYIDIREEEKGFSSYEKSLEIKPDYKLDFTKLPFKDKQFKLIVFDPPHKKHRNIKGIFDLKYGNLRPETWQSDLKRGFKELWRVLDDYGVLIFKWNESEIKLKQVLNLFFIKPLFGNKTGVRGNTVWSCFMKIPKVNGQRVLSSDEESLIAIKRDSAESPNSPQIHNKKLEEANFS